MKETSILVIGGGPTGLGAAYQLHKLGHTDWLLLEKESRAGGLSASFLDDKGFTWDMGGHVIFSHYDYFDRATDEFLGADQWLRHRREAWIWMRDRFIPYPLQNNLHYFAEDDLYACLVGLAQCARAPIKACDNFADWIQGHFGDGLSRLFMTPYNQKVWAYPLDKMGVQWMGERVAPVKLEEALEHVVYKRDDRAWGPNRTFRFPQSGGTGAVWNACAAWLPQERIRREAEVVNIDLSNKTASTADGETYRYQSLISTMPIPELVALSDRPDMRALATDHLHHASTHVVGLGLAGQPRRDLADKCWMYFPESNCPFYRPRNVPDPERYWSLMCEVSESPWKPVQRDQLSKQVVEGALNARLIEDPARIVSLWQRRAEYGYPIPATGRDKALATLVPFFESFDVYTRGRFGLWRYEAGNQDHAFMQGVEVAERLVNGRTEITGFDPSHANSTRHPWPFERWTRIRAS